MSRKDKGADKAADKGAGKPASGPLGPWRLALVMLAVAGTSGAVLAQSVQTGVGLDMALARALGVAVVLWILLGSIDRMLAHAPRAACRRGAALARRHRPGGDRHPPEPPVAPHTRRWLASPNTK